MALPRCRACSKGVAATTSQQLLLKANNTAGTFTVETWINGVQIGTGFTLTVT